MKESFVEMKVLRNELEMSVAPMSRYKKRAYQLGCIPKNDEKMNLVYKGLKK